MGPELDFIVSDALAVAHAAAPTIAFKLQIQAQNPDVTIHSISLRAQIMIEAPKRPYNQSEQEKLVDIFGEPERWAQTLRSMLWTNVSIVVPPFQGETIVDLPVPCSFDFNLSGTKFFHGLEEGEVPLAILFSGSIFYESENGGMQVSQISWSKEARYKLPVQTWKKMMDLYYPNMAWLCLGRDAFDRLYLYKLQKGIPTWDQAIHKLLDATQIVV